MSGADLLARAWARKTGIFGKKAVPPCLRSCLAISGSEHERDQLMQRIGQLHAQHGQGYDHQDGAEMHEG